MHGTAANLCINQCHSILSVAISGNQWHPILSVAISGIPPFLTWRLRPRTPVTARAKRVLTLVTLRRGVAVRQRKQLGPPSGTSCPPAASLRLLWRGVTQLPSAPVPMAFPAHSLVHSIIASITEAAHAHARRRQVSLYSLHLTPCHATRHLWSFWSRAAVPPPSFGHFGRAPPPPLVLLVAQCGTGYKRYKAGPRWVITYH
jgi:hypothetical protein